MNASFLEHLINVNVLESLLAAEIVETRSPDIGECISMILTSIRTTALQIYNLSKEETTLPSLLLCLRDRPKDTKMVSQVFTIVRKWWHDKEPETKVPAQVTFGFIAAAVRCLSRSTFACMPSMDEVSASLFS